HPMREQIRRKRLLQERRLTVDYASSHDLVVRIARHEKNAYAWTSLEDSLDQLASVHLGHYDVCGDKIDFAFILRDDSESLRAGSGDQDVVAERPQDARPKGANGFVVFREKHCLVAARR